MMTKRFLASGAAGALSFISAASSAAPSSSGGSESWTVPLLVAVAGAAVLLLAVTFWRRQAKAKSEAIDRARSRALHRHTERLATQIAEPDF